MSSNTKNIYQDLTEPVENGKPEFYIIDDNVALDYIFDRERDWEESDEYGSSVENLLEDDQETVLMPSGITALTWKHFPEYSNENSITEVKNRLNYLNTKTEFADLKEINLSDINEDLRNSFVGDLRDIKIAHTSRSDGAVITYDSDFDNPYVEMISPSFT